MNNLKSMKHKGIKTPQHVISLGRVQGLRGIENKGGTLAIWAMTTITELMESPAVSGNLEVLRVVARNISTCAIRNMATVGGNLTCRYTWTEMPAVMLALEADLHFLGTDGKEETVAAETFYRNGAKTDKLFTHVSIKLDPQARMAYRRVKKSPNVDIPMLSLLIKTHFRGNRFDRPRVGINNCIDFAQRDRTLESFLDKKERNGKIAEEALDHINDQIYDRRSSDYKKHVFRVSLSGAIKELTQIK